MSRITCKGLWRIRSTPKAQACAFGVLLMRQSPLQVILLICLGLVLRGKAQREERCLVASHPEYAATMGQTPAIAAVIPGLNWRLPDGPSNEG